MQSGRMLPNAKRNEREVLVTERLTRRQFRHYAVDGMRYAWVEKHVPTFHPPLLTPHFPGRIPRHRRLFIRIKWEGILRSNAIAFLHPDERLHSFANFPLAIT